jgi:hypothetical protein
VPPRRPTPSQARKAIPGYRGRGARHRAFSKAVIQKQHRSFPASMAYPKGRCPSLRPCRGRDENLTSGRALILDPGH